MFYFIRIIFYQLRRRYSSTTYVKSVTKGSYILRKGACFPLFATYILFLMVYIISDYKDNIKYVFTILESYSINKRQKDCLWKQRTHYRLENGSLSFIETLHKQ